MIQHKYRQAIENANLIYPISVAKLGEDHQVSMTILGTRAASEGYLHMWDEAIRDDLTLYELASRKQGPASGTSIEALSDAALSQCRAGRYAQGESNARKAMQESLKAFGPRTGMSGGTSYTLAVCLIGMNKQLEEASELLRNINVDAVAQLSGDSGVSASIALAQGEIAARKGDYALARRYVQTAAPVIDQPNSDESDKQAIAKLRSTIDLHLHDASLR